MMLDGHAISLLIPHQGSMCLLDTVEEWDAQHIVCTTKQHVLGTKTSQVNPAQSEAGL